MVLLYSSDNIFIYQIHLMIGTLSSRKICFFTGLDLIFIYRIEVGNRICFHMAILFTVRCLIAFPKNPIDVLELFWQYFGFNPKVEHDDYWHQSNCHKRQENYSNPHTGVYVLH
jgi:hypothetical protein